MKRDRQEQYWVVYSTTAVPPASILNVVTSATNENTTGDLIIYLSIDALAHGWPFEAVCLTRCLNPESYQDH